MTQIGIAHVAHEPDFMMLHVLIRRCFAVTESAGLDNISFCASWVRVFHFDVCISYNHCGSLAQASQQSIRPSLILHLEISIKHCSGVKSRIMLALAG